MGEGERFKSLRTLEKALAVLSQAGLERHDVVVALGGGVVGDVAGFAAAVYLRGIPFIQVPTTLLAQIDSSVGGKTGINLATGKNLVGAFHQPSAVVIDTETLATLPARELSAGWCEAVKMGAVDLAGCSRTRRSFWSLRRRVKRSPAHCASDSSKR
jgi:3-dehydroquinate synthetase